MYQVEQQFGKAKPQCAGSTLPIRVSHRQMAVRSEREVGQWRMAEATGNVGWPVHPRRLCHRGRIQDDRLLRRVDHLHEHSA